MIEKNISCSCRKLTRKSAFIWAITWRSYVARNIPSFVSCYLRVRHHIYIQLLKTYSGSVPSALILIQRFRDWCLWYDMSKFVAIFSTCMIFTFFRSWAFNWGNILYCSSRGLDFTLMKGINQLQFLYSYNSGLSSPLRALGKSTLHTMTLVLF